MPERDLGGLSLENVSSHEIQRFPPNLKWCAHTSYVRSANLHGA